MTDNNFVSFTQAICLTAVVLGCIFIYRIQKIIYSKYSRNFVSNELSLNVTKAPVSTIIVFGSGGHTSEMLRLITNLSSERYSPMYFVLAQSDHTSISKIQSAQLHFKDIKYIHIHRSREVKQSWLTTMWTTLLSLVDSIPIILRTRPAVILCNGPGTCVPLVYAAFLLHVLGLCRPHIIFVESFCRVKSLSLTGKLLYYLVDSFVVQWPELTTKYRRAAYIGKIC